MGIDFGKIADRIELAYDESMLTWPGDWTQEMKDDFIHKLNELASNPGFGLSVAQSQGLDTAMEKLLGAAWKGGSMALTALTTTVGILFTQPAAGNLLNTTKTIHEDCATRKFADELGDCQNQRKDFKATPILGLDAVQTFYVGCLLEMATFGGRSTIRPQLARAQTQARRTKVRGAVRRAA
jgi:hypothetical protein